MALDVGTMADSIFFAVDFADLDELTAFASEALNDPDFLRYQPDLPGDGCIVVDVQDGLNDRRCP